MARLCLVASLGLLLLLGCSGASTSAPLPAATRPAAATATPFTSTLTGDVVVRRLKAAGMPITKVAVFTVASDPHGLSGHPGEYVSKAVFQDGRLGAADEVSIDSGGSIEIYATAADAEDRKADIERIAQASSLFSEYDFTSGIVLLRLSHALSPDQAAEYQKALATIR